MTQYGVIYINIAKNRVEPRSIRVEYRGYIAGIEIILKKSYNKTLLTLPRGKFFCQSKLEARYKEK